jgi:hypothetical protein
MLMKVSRKSALAIALAAATLAALPTSALASTSSACDAARQGNTFEAWFYRTFMC